MTKDYTGRILIQKKLLLGCGLGLIAAVPTFPESGKKLPRFFLPQKNGGGEPDAMGGPIIGDSCTFLSGPLPTVDSITRFWTSFAQGNKWIRNP